MEERSLLAIGLVEIAADQHAPIVSGQVRDVAPRELVFRFDAAVDPNSLFGIQIQRSGDGIFGNGNDINVDPLRSPSGAFPNGFLGIGSRPNEVIVRFGEVLPDDFYRITIFGAGPNAILDTTGVPFNNGVDTTIDFRLALGAQVLAVVPQPITHDAGGSLQQARNVIEVYFNNDDLDGAAAQNPNFYQLIFTNNTATNTDDVVYLPSSVSYDPVLDKATLFFASDLDQLGSGTGTFRLRIGSGDAPASSVAPEVPVALNPGTDIGSSYETALDLGGLDRQGLIVQARIEPQPYGLTFPGGNDEPGHREISAENHLRGVADTTDGITTIFYDFRSDYGVDPFGNPLLNVISETQKQRAREVLEMYSHYLGVRFVETNPAPGTPSIGFTIATGDMRAVSPTATSGPNDGITGIAGTPNVPFINGQPVPVFSKVLAIMDSSESTLWGASEFGGNWFREAMREIGQVLGYGLATEQDHLTLNRSDLLFLAPGGGNTVEPVFPGDHDIVHGQYLYRPESKDIDLYKFTVTETGVLRAETFAERLPTASLLDTVITLFGDVLTIVAPDAGGAAILDGETFTLSDGVHTVTFEFDEVNAAGVTTGNHRVVFSAGDTAEEIAAAIAGAIADVPAFGVTAVAQFDRVKLRGALDASVAGTNSLALTTIREIIASNDDYYSEDSFMELTLGAGTYYIGVSSRGNTRYDPMVEDSGFGGTTQGNYHLRMNFTPTPATVLTDVDGTPLDGDVDGVPGGDFNFWFQVGDDANTIYVDKSFTGVQLGTLSNPFNNIQAAFAAAIARPGNEIVRVVGNGGVDGNLATLADNLPYSVGFNTNGLPLADGTTLNVPRGVTMMIDAGTIFKMRLANIDVGSSSQNIDRSEGHLQVLGIPGQSVYFTSALDETIGTDVTPIASVPAGGNWGGIVLRNDLDYAEGRPVLEREGIFLNYINGADIRYGGGDVVVNSISQRFTPIHLVASRPTISYNTITRSADAAMSADPNSFLDTRFQGPDFTADYERNGPHIRRNTLAVRLPNGSAAQNSVNGLFVRIRTQAGSPLDVLTGTARWDDADIPHILAENLIVRGTPQGAALTGSEVTPLGPLAADEVFGPGSNDTLATAVDTTLPVVPSGQYRVFRDSGVIGDNPNLLLGPGDDRDVDFFRFDLAAGSRVTINVDVLHDPLNQIPTLDANLRLFDANGVELAFSDANPAGTEQPFGATIDPFIDFIAPTTGTYYVAVAGNENRNYDPSTEGSSPTTGAISTGTYDIEITVSTDAASLDARLRIDPGILVKAAGSRIETGIGAQFIAEGTAERPIIFTSLRDDRYGSGGTMDTNADQANTFTSPGDWGGIFLGHLSQGSLDHVVITFGGGRTRIEGNFDQFNALEIHQAEARVANSVFESNGTGLATTLRNGRAENAAATIFVRGAQPILVNNIIRDGLGAAISINANAMQWQPNADFGRTTGLAHAFNEHEGNQGPIVADNRLGGNALNGMEVRGGTLTTQTVWDDTDIVHIVRSEIIATNHHVYSGLRLQSSPDESLVVKLAGANAGFTATGEPLDISDRIGGSVQIAGRIGFPVILTGLGDNTVGAGFDPDGNPQRNTVATPNSSSGQWRSIRLDQYSNDRNFETTYELESAQTHGVERNGTSATAQVLGQLAPDQKSGDENRRLGFEVRGTIAFDTPGDVDVYSFVGFPGTEVWIDVDRTSPSLDTVIELVDADGNVIARSDDSEIERTTGLFPSIPVGQNIAHSLQRGAFGGRDVYTTNRRDAGMRLVLPGAAGVEQTYFVRVYSKNAVESGNPTPQPYQIGAGDTSGNYQFQIRLQEEDEVGGSTVRFSDIRFATTGIEVLGLPGHSPLVGDAAERANDAGNEGQAGALNVGNLLQTDLGSLSIAGAMASATDVDWYRFTVDYDQIDFETGLRSVALSFDIDYADGLARPDTVISVFDSQGRLVLVARDSDILDDQLGPTPELGSSDLSRGSFGKLDPYIGPQQFPAGQTSAPATSQTYFVAVSSNAQLPTVLNMTFQSTAASPTVRLEPVQSVRRIAEDHIGFSGYSSGQATSLTTQIDPYTSSLIDIDSSISLQANVKPFTLADVPLFVSTTFDVFLVNANNGGLEATYNNALPGFNERIEDIDFRTDGRLFAYASAVAANNQNNAGRLIEINTQTGALVSNAPDDIQDATLNTSQVDALTIQRTGANAQGVPLYDFIYYSVRAPNFATPFSVLFSANAAGDANVQNPFRGLIGPIAVNTPGDVGVTTGMAFDPNQINLYGVTDQGHFIHIDRFSGQATILLTIPGLQFSGLTQGPQNMDFNQDGIYGDLANTFFAITTNGELVAIEVDPSTGVATQRAVFDANGDGVLEDIVQTTAFGATGLAFSPVDFNLWHPTMNRRNDAGHGINPTFDQGRFDPQNALRLVGSSSDLRQQTEQNGGASMYFGLEQWVQNPFPNDYFTYTYQTAQGFNTFPNAQYGILSTSAHRDLAATSGGDNVNLPGGAKGSLITNSFSLEGYNATDKPTLYFNYFLATENVDSSTNQMRDSARVFISADGGLTWSMVATNNSIRNNASELPLFSSASSNVDSNPATLDPRQRVQELFDNTGGWRQARIDLGEFAGQSNLILRFDFSTAGSMGEGIPGDEYGRTFHESRFQNNNVEGFYVDDIVIGFAERGEMVTNAPANTAFFQVPQNPNAAAPAEVLTGEYQLEIRTASEYAANIFVNASPVVAGPSIVFPEGFIMDTNDRLTNTFTLIAPAGSGVVDGQRFQISDGVTTVTFEFETAGGVAPGNVPIVFDPADTPAKMASRIRDAINAQGSLLVGAVAIASSNRVELTGVANVIVNDVPRNLTVDIAADVVSENGGSVTATVTRSGSLVGDLFVTLTSSDNGQATVPMTVLIPNGQASATFNVSPVNDTLADGTNTVIITASALGFNSITDTLDVTDDDTATLSVIIASPATISESAGAQAITATVTRNSSVTGDLVVNLLSTDTSEARVPATVTIPAGSSSAMFFIDAFNDPWIDGNQTVRIIAYAAGFASGSAQLTVLDDGLDQTPQTLIGGGSGGGSAPFNPNATVAPAPDADKIALNYLLSVADAQGFTTGEGVSVITTDKYVSSHTGVTHIWVRQTYNGLEILGTETNINVGPDGSVLSINANLVSSQAFALVGVEPQIDPIEAVRAAGAQLIDPSLESVEVSVVEQDGGPAQSMVLVAPEISLDPIPVKLSYVRMAGGIELVWSMILRTPDGNHWYDVGVSTVTATLPFVSDWVSHASYEAFHYNLENPDDGPRTIEVDPHLANSTASPFGWHDTNGLPGPEFTDTRGNNVFAQEDQDGNNIGGARPNGGPGLNFSFTFDPALDPIAYTAAATTNLFYLNNILHDIHYQYGFDELSGNFQFNNYGRGGLGGDPVQADSQDGSGLNNANFATPPDGFSPRMQQFLFTFTLPRRDSSLENSIIIHEYGHGVSTRLTGGPSNSNALNAIQSGGMGEGWGDFWGLMFAQKITDGQFDAYPVGTYVLGDPPTGPGIRRFPYSFDMTINPLTYGDFNGGFPNNEEHNAGEIWASALWDMNWLLINKYGFDPDLYNGNGGNNLALQLVMDGLKLQPANPSFLDGRDAILLADQILTGGANQMEIWTAFARRGMGLSAFDGGSGNSTVVVEAFDLPVFGVGHTVSVSITEASISENGGMATATVTRSGPISADLVVSLISSDQTEAIAIPSQIVIPTGQASVTFGIFGVDDLIADGTQTVTITASTPGFDSVVDTLDILDDEVAALTVSILEEAIREDAGRGAATVTVTRNTPTDEDLVVFLHSSDTSEVVINSTVQGTAIPGQLTGFNDDRGSLTTVGTPLASALAGTANADGVIRLGVSGFPDFNFNGNHFQSGGYELFVLVGTSVFPTPFNPNNFTFSFADSLAPGDVDFFSIPGILPGTPFIAWTNNNVGFGTPDTMLASFLSFGTSTADITSAVLIPAGQTSATFQLDAVNELLPDGTQTVTITAYAPGIASGSDTLDVLEVSNALKHERFGDANIERTQGQVILHSNRILSASQFGIVVDSSVRDQGGNRPHPGAVRNTRELNIQQWVPGVVLANNVLAFNGQGGIHFSGDPLNGNPANPPAAIPFGRIINNTVFGTDDPTTQNDPQTGVGIQIDEFASPTLMNNIVSRLAVGLSISNDSSSTVVGGMLYRDNAQHTQTPANIGQGGFALDLDLLSPLIPLFRNPAAGDFTLVEGSLAIDSSIDSLSDRPDLVAVTQPLGISQSSILAPELDQLGRLRIDNPLVASPPGLGENVFKDRGALERLDPVTVGVDDVSIVEGDLGSQFLVFSVRLSEVLSIPFMVFVNTSGGTATPGSDFANFSGTVTFTPGESVVLVTVEVFGDVMDEDDETFFLNLSSPSAGAAITNFQGTATIINDDLPPSLSVFDQSIFEGDTSLFNVVLVLTLSAPSGRNVSVDFSTSNGTAVAGLDYLPASGRITFTPGVSTAAITMQTIGDKTVEADETFTLTLANPTNATLVATQATITILDDDAVVNINDVTVTESDTGGVNAIFSVTLTKPASSPVTMTFVTSNQTATAGLDYTATAGTLSFAPTETFKTITVPILGDTLDEGAETFIVQIANLTNAASGKATGVATIIDNDPSPIVSISPTATVDAEGDTGTTSALFRVTLSAPSGQNVVVQYATADGTATAGQDYTAVMNTLTIFAGFTQATIIVPVIGDTVAEPDETFTVTLFNAGNATIGTATSTATIPDDDSRMSISDATLSEPAIGGQVMLFTVTMTPSSSVPVTVEFTTQDITAVAGQDYTATSGTLTFLPGEFQKTISVAVLADSTDEPDETFSVVLSNVSSGSLLADAQGVGTILDDDPAPTINIASTARPEGTGASTSMPFVVTLSNPSGQVVTVRFVTANGSALAGGDYLPTSGTLTFLPGTTQQTINVTVLGDALVESDETFFVNLHTPTNATLGVSQGTGTIQDDEAQLSVNDVVVIEGNSGSVNAVFTVTLSKISGGVVTVRFVTTDGTATAGQDYIPVLTTLTFAPGQTVQMATVPVLGDTLSEGPETFNVTLTASSGATIGDGQGVGTIQDNDPIPVLFIDSVAVTEGNAGATTAILTITMSAPQNRQVTVNFATANQSATAGADYVPTSGAVTFAAGETAKQIAVQILGDTASEPTETFHVNLFNSVNASIAGGTGVVTIVDNDPAPFTVTGAGAGGGPHIRVLDSLSGAERFGLFAYSPAFTGGVRVATADLNGDGQLDIITVPGTGGGPHVRVFNGHNGALIHEFMAFEPNYTGGLTVAAGDVDLDGRPDLIIGTDGAGGNRVRIFSGQLNGSIINSFNFPAGTSFQNGARVATGDVNGDGRADVIVAAGPGSTPRVLALDGLTGATLRDFFAYSPAYSGGVSVAAADLNNDGRADIITGPGIGGGPHVRAFSGATGQVLREFFAYHPNFQGGVRLGAVDANADGRLDIVTAPGVGGGPHIRVFDVPSLAVLGEYFAYSPLFTGGVYVAGAGVASASPLMAAQGQGPGSAGSQLTDEQLQPILVAAVDRWRLAGVDEAALQRLSAADVRIADLAPGYLGLALGSTVYIDVDAAGHGWFIDATPGADEEFGDGAASPEAGSRVDLLTAVMHELGHVLGLEDAHGDGHDDELMAELLETGVRHTPALQAVDRVFGADWN